jgi:hypothetical protein
MFLRIGPKSEIDHLEPHPFGVSLVDPITHPIPSSSSIHKPGSERTGRTPRPFDIPEPIFRVPE